MAIVFEFFRIGIFVLDTQEIKKIAMLARIALTNLEEQKMQQELGCILEYFQQIQHAPILQIAPHQTTSQILPNESNLDKAVCPTEVLHSEEQIQTIYNPNSLRQDQIHSGLSRESALANATQKTSEFFIVPKILGQ